MHCACLWVWVTYWLTHLRTLTLSVQNVTTQLANMLRVLTLESCPRLTERTFPLYYGWLGWVRCERKQTKGYKRGRGWGQSAACQGLVPWHCTRAHVCVPLSGWERGILVSLSSDRLLNPLPVCPNGTFLWGIVILEHVESMDESTVVLVGIFLVITLLASFSWILQSHGHP